MNGIICSTDGKGFKSEGFCNDGQVCTGPTKDDSFVKPFPFLKRQELCTRIKWKGIFNIFLGTIFIIWDNDSYE